MIRDNCVLIILTTAVITEIIAYKCFHKCVYVTRYRDRIYKYLLIKIIIIAHERLLLDQVSR